MPAEAPPVTTCQRGDTVEGEHGTYEEQHVQRQGNAGHGDADADHDDEEQQEKGAADDDQQHPGQRSRTGTEVVDDHGGPQGSQPVEPVAETGMEAHELRFGALGPRGLLDPTSLALGGDLGRQRPHPVDASSAGDTGLHLGPLSDLAAKDPSLPGLRADDEQVGHRSGARDDAPQLTELGNAFGDPVRVACELNGVGVGQQGSRPPGPLQQGRD